VDYGEGDIILDILFKQLWLVKSDKLQEIAKAAGYDQCSWSGHINNGEVTVIFRRYYNGVGVNGCATLEEKTGD
jgi:hypothetical protein